MVSLAVSASRAQGRARQAHWSLAGAQFLLLVAALTSLNGIFQGSGWWWLAVLVSALVFAALAVLRRLGVPGTIAPLAGLGVGLLVLTMLFGGGTGVLWIVPTPATIAHFASLTRDGLAAVNEQAIPAQELPELMFLLAAGTVLAAEVMDTLSVAMRLPAVCGLVIFGILAVPAILLADGVSPLWVAACAASYALLLRTGVRASRRGIGRPLLSVAMTASATVVALVVAVTAPAFTGGGSLGFGSGMSVGYGVSPLIDLGKDLRRPTSMTVLHYSTTSPDGEYLKLLSLDRFSGSTWTHGRGPMKHLDTGSDLTAPPGLDGSVKTTTVTTRVDTGNVQSPWLPAPYPVKTVRGLSGDWAYDTSDLSISSRQANASNRSYRVTSLHPQPTPEQLSGPASYPAEIQKDLALPDEHMPKIITRTAERVTADASDNYQKAVDLQDYFRNTDFVYSVEAPVEQGYDGDGLDVIATFLKKKAGYCVHFASAMAIMARVLGIPSRVAVGYLPGTRTGGFIGDRAVYQVSSDDLHAWPELYFPRVGWVRFEPTVGLGVVPAYSEPITAPVTSETSTEPTTSAAASPTPTPTLSSQALTPTGTTQDSSGGFQALVIILIAALACLMPAAIRVTRRRVRRYRIRRARAPASLAWAEIADGMRDLGYAAPPTESPRARAGRLRTLLPAGEHERLEHLLGAVERERFGPPGSPAAGGADLDDDLQALLAALRRSAGLPARAKAALLPASLLPAVARAGQPLGETA